MSPPLQTPFAAIDRWIFFGGGAGGIAEIGCDTLKNSAAGVLLHLSRDTEQEVLSLQALAKELQTISLHRSPGLRAAGSGRVKAQSKDNSRELLFVQTRQLDVVLEHFLVLGFAATFS